MKKIILSVLVALQLLSCKKEDGPQEGSNMDEIDYHQTASTQFIKVGEVKFAYRVLGKTDDIPLVMVSPLGSSMDDWDPAITNGLAEKNKVILFDLEGAGSSSGHTPENIPDMAKGVVAFIKALGYKKVNLLGFSMGGFISQQIILTEPTLVNKLILTGTGPKGSEGLSKLPELLESTANLSPEESFLHVGFTKSDASRQAGKRVYERIQKRVIDRDLPLSAQSATAELTAVLKWATPYPDALKELATVKQPVLIAQGQEDVPTPVINAIKMSEHIPNARLIVYKDAGHAAAFQYALDFVQQAIEFLNN
ncbi:alpha/beta hydrolase [Olivibacter sp. LS-1]|uniref:alpha/beta fold hydrolase n=1 Tax=unclassified Olivibacter TaxID=2632301 RepID=UPI0011EA766D|nr:MULTISPECIES: alpha/beta hydrolase [unclassified Olivibacter]MDM8173278.1 alpha/beta hydrolase [Olivibacter sp. 47]QEL03059.1 alpha/beta hydrolase [Olivibacter sp. LS-1]